MAAVILGKERPLLCKQAGNAAQVEVPVLADFRKGQPAQRALYARLPDAGLLCQFAQGGTPGRFTLLQRALYQLRSGQGMAERPVFRVSLAGE